MKQVFCFLLIFALICSAFTVFAEDSFSFRNGICFGDSKNIVLEKENEFSPGKSRDNTIVFSDLCLSEINDSFVKYNFDFEDRLYAIFIRYDQSKNNVENFDYQSQNYNKVETKLDEMYGSENDAETLASDGGIISYLNAHYPGITFIKNSQRIIVHDESKIFIQHVLAKSPIGNYYWHHLSYHIEYKD